MKNINLKDIFTEKIKKKFEKAIGAYVDEENNLFCVYLKLEGEIWKVIDTIEDKIYSDEKNFSEKIAEKISEQIKIKNWRTNSIAFCLSNDKVVIYIDDFSVVPKDKLQNAVHYQMAVAGNFEPDEYFSSYVEIDSNIWMEAISKKDVFKWTESFSKNNLDLLTLTAVPDEIESVEEINLENVGGLFLMRGGIKAIIAAKSLIFKKKPNFILERTDNLNGLNILKINTAIFLITIFALIGFGIYDFWNYKQAEEILQNERDELELLEKDRRKEEFINKIQNELKNKNQILTSLSEESFPFRSLLIHFGTIKIKGVWLREIRTLEDETIEIKGEAVNYEAVGNYVKALENDREIFSKVEMKSSEMKTENQLVRFTIILTI